MKKYAIIVAGGKGLRMGAELPKQFIEIGGKPILVHTIERFLRSDAEVNVILVLPKDSFGIWGEISANYLPERSISIVEGGVTRFQSVKNGLGLVADNSLVAVHDAVRPVIDPNIINKSFEVAEEKGSAVVSMPSKDSLRKVNQDGGSVAVPRDQYRIIQTPQTFSSEILKEAYAVQEIPEFTDDASVVERAGYNVTLIEGSYQNIKITTPEDLLVAELFISSN